MEQETELALCYTCLRTSKVPMINLEEVDYDKVTFLNKLQTCINFALEEIQSPRVMCQACLRQLRVSYQFYQIVMESQKSLKENPPVDNQEIVEEKFIVEEIESEAAVYDTDPLDADNTEMNLDYWEEEKIAEEEPIDTYEIEEQTDDTESDEEQSDYSEEEIKHEETDDKEDEDELSEYSEIETKLELTDDTESEDELSEYYEIQQPKQEQIDKEDEDEQPEHSEGFVCWICGTVFTSKPQLQRHLTSRHHPNMLDTHDVQHVFLCSKCPEIFPQKFLLERHLRTHRSYGRKSTKTPFLCTICGKNFPYSNSLSRHMRVHTGEKNYPCTVCKRKFNQSTHLKVHLRTHTGEKPYICDTCGEKFSLKVSLRRHLCHCGKINL